MPAPGTPIHRATRPGGPLRRSGPRAGRGFSLIEAMITFMVAAIGFLAITRLQTVTTDSAVVTAQGNEAVEYAEDKLNSFRAAGGYAALVSGSDSITGTNATYARAWSVANYTFKNGVEISATGGNTCNGTDGGCFKAVTLTVSWTDITGVPRTLTLSTNLSSVDPSASGGLSTGP